MTQQLPGYLPGTLVLLPVPYGLLLVGPVSCMSNKNGLSAVSGSSYLDQSLFIARSAARYYYSLSQELSDEVATR